MNITPESLSNELLEFYTGEIAPCVPQRILDFHAHTWSAGNWKELPWESADPAGRYMVVREQYGPEDLIRDGCTCFPDCRYEAVCFGFPTPAVDWEKDTAYIAHAARQYSELHPLLLAGPALKLEKNQYIEAVDEGGFLGFKVFLNWYGNDYGDIRVEDMVGAGFMAWEIVLAIRWAAEMGGISEKERNSIFYDNGMKLLKNSL